MEQRISIVTFGVKDLATSKHFYADGLGWKPAFENNEIIFFQTGGMIFALFLREKLAEDFQADADSFGHAAVALAYNVRDRSEVDPLTTPRPWRVLGRANVGRIWCYCVFSWNLVSAS